MAVTCSGVAYEDGPYYFISPGIKLSYVFGAPAGFSFGWELSIYRTIAWNPGGAEEGFIGFTLDIDWCKSMTKIHLGLEGSQRVVGFCLGPSLVIRDDVRNLGVSATIYSWFVALPYYSYTFVPGAADIHELGGFVKIPIQLNGRSIFAFRVGG